MASILLSDTAYWLGGVLLGLAGLYLLITGWRGRVPRKPTCRKCRYDMSAASSLACSECGYVHRNAGYLWRPRARRWRFVIGLLLCSFVYYAHAWPSVKWRQWAYEEPWYKSIVPTTVWIVLLPKLDEENRTLLTDRLHIIPHATSEGDIPNLTGITDWQGWLLMRSCDTILKDKAADLDLQQNALGWVIGMAPRVDNAVEPLTTALLSPDESIRNSAIVALERMGERALPVLPQIAAAINDPSEFVSFQASWVLLNQRPHIDSSDAALLAHYDRAMPSMLRVLLANADQFASMKIGPLTRDLILKSDELVALAALKALIDPNDEPQWQITALTKYGGTWSGASPLVPGLVEMLAGKSYRQEYVIARALTKIGAIDPGDVPVIRAALASAPRDRKLFLLHTLPMLGPNATEAILPLLDSDEFHDDAVQALYSLGPSAAEAIMPVSKSILDRAGASRWTVVDALHWLTVAPPDLIEELEKRLTSYHRPERLLAYGALRHWDPQRLNRHLIGTIKSSTRGARLEAIEMLGAMGTASEPALIDLHLAAENAETAEDRILIRAAIEAIQKSIQENAGPP